MEAKVLKAESRSKTGKNANRQLRLEGHIPAVLYSHGKSESLQVGKKDFFNLFKGNISESVIFTLDIADKSEKKEELAFVKNYELNPVSGEIIHLDFFRVTRGEKITTQVPLHFTGTAAGVKIGGIMDILERELEVECLPKDLPEVIEVDVSELMIGDSFFVKDLKISEAVKVVLGSEAVIASVHAVKIKEEKTEVEEGEDVKEAGEEAKESEDKGKESTEKESTEKK